MGAMMDLVFTPVLGAKSGAPQAAPAAVAQGHQALVECVQHLAAGGHKSVD